MLKQLFVEKGKPWALLILVALISACSDDRIEIVSQFANTQDINQGSAVYLDDKVIGEVLQTRKQNAGSRVVLAIDQAAAQTLSNESVVVVNRLKQGAPLEIYNRYENPNITLKDGEEIIGLDSMLQLSAWMVNGAIQLGSDSLASYWQSFQDYMNNGKFQNDKQRVGKQINVATQATQQVIQQAEQEVSTAMRELANSEKQMVAAIKQMGEELSPIAKQLGKSGSVLMQELTTLVETLQKSNQQEQKAGTEFIQTLKNTIEQLKQKAQQGAQE